MAASGQLMLKLGAEAGGRSVSDFINLKILLGLSFYFLGMLIWIYCLSRVPLSLVYAFTALTFCLVYVFAMLLCVIFHQHIGQNLTNKIINKWTFKPINTYF